jgi:hypothetical protein
MLRTFGSLWHIDFISVSQIQIVNAGRMGFLCLFIGFDNNALINVFSEKVQKTVSLFVSLIVCLLLTLRLCQISVAKRFRILAHLMGTLNARCSVL